MKLTVWIEGKENMLPIRKPGDTLLAVFRENGVTEVASPCGGNGTCGKCLVFVEGRGKVLACRTQAEDGMRVRIEKERTSLIAQEGDCFLYPADGSSHLAAACDIGTTTVVCHLLDGRTGERLGTVSAPNAQRAFGADVISRIQAAKEDGLTRLHHAITDQVNGMLRCLLRQCERSNSDGQDSAEGEIAGRSAGNPGSRCPDQRPIDLLAVAGNTVMCHLFAGLSPESIGVAPFTPLSRFGMTMDPGQAGILFCKKIYIAPAAAGYVGGDITADLLAVRIGAEEETLLLDIGTNGEMVLGKGGNYVCCATAAGPAFEGAEISMGMPAAEGAVSSVWMEGPKICMAVIGGGSPVGICGSGLVDALAVFLESGLVDETGRIAEEDEVEEELADYLGEDEHGSCILLSEDIKITQADVRKLQLAKAAVAAGIRILLKERNLPVHAVKKVILAGGFGSFLNKRSAARIGLIPEELLDVTVSVGNAAGEGAVSAAVSGEARAELARLRETMHYVELSTHKAFSDEYIEQMFF